MSLPEYVRALNLSALPVDYEWDTVHFNTYWSVSDEVDPRLAEALQLIAVKAAFAFAVASSEWVVARVEGHVDTTDALLRIEAGWAAAMDPRYAKLPVPPASPPAAAQQFASPLRLAMKLLSYAHELCTGDGEGVRSSAQGLAMAVVHIAGRQGAFKPWFAQALRRCHEHFPASARSVEDEPPVARELFDPGFAWSDDRAQAALQRFVHTLNPASNPYLRSAEEMLAAGFSGQPYGRPT
jgi:hypothetical protein